MSQEDYQAGRDRLLLPPSEIDLEQPPSHLIQWLSTLPETRKCTALDAFHRLHMRSLDALGNRRPPTPPSFTVPSVSYFEEEEKPSITTLHHIGESVGDRSHLVFLSTSPPNLILDTDSRRTESPYSPFSTTSTSSSPPPLAALFNSFHHSTSSAPRQGKRKFKHFSHDQASPVNNVIQPTELTTLEPLPLSPLSPSSTSSTSSSSPSPPTPPPIHSKFKHFSSAQRKVLQAWVDQNPLHEKVSLADRKQLALLTGLTEVQVCTWCSNWRVRKRPSKQKKLKIDDASPKIVQ